MRVCPLFQCRPDEAFSLAVRLGPIRPGTLVFYAELAASIAKLPRLVASAVIRQYSLYSDAVRGVPGNRKPQKFYCRVRCFIWKYRRIGSPGGVIHAHMQIFPTWSTAADLPCSRLFVPNTINLAEAFDIQVKHLPRLFPLVAHNLLFYFQRRKPRTTELAQSPKDAAATNAETFRYFVSTQLLLAQRPNGTVILFAQLVPALMWTRTSVRQCLRTTLPITAHPFSGGAHTDAEARRHSGGGAASHPPDHFLSTFKRQFGILMAVHPRPLRFSCCVVTPALNS